jgi:hypothetical protein
MPVNTGRSERVFSSRERRFSLMMRLYDRCGIFEGTVLVNDAGMKSDLNFLSCFVMPYGAKFT